MQPPTVEVSIEGIPWYLDKSSIWIVPKPTIWGWSTIYGNPLFCSNDDWLITGGILPTFGELRLETGSTPIWTVKTNGFPLQIGFRYGKYIWKTPMEKPMVFPGGFSQQDQLPWQPWILSWSRKCVKGNHSSSKGRDPRFVMNHKNMGFNGMSWWFNGILWWFNGFYDDSMDFLII